jgi:hypothetical protein
MSDMSTYLSDVTADYTTTSLSVTPQAVMEEAGDFNQIVRKMDDGSNVVTTLSGSLFTVTLQWIYLSSTDAETILDFYHTAAKAKGRERSFYWLHPIDGNYYTVRFLGPLQRVYKANMPGGTEISEIQLEVKGNKP